MFELGPVVVGVVLLLAGLVKALDAPEFALHLARLANASWPTKRGVASLLLATEAALGAALIVCLWTRLLIPAALVLVATLAALTFWGVRSGRIEECGCYGGLLHLELWQSLALDGLYVALLAAGYATGAGFDRGAEPWKIALTGSAALLTAVLAEVSWRYSSRHQYPLVTWSPFRVGRRWESRWLGHPNRYDLADGEHLVAFLSRQCHQCQAWMRVFDQVHPRPDLPDVIAVFPLPEEDLEDLAATFSYPIASLGRLAFRRLTYGYPNAVLVEDGEIQEVWLGNMPMAFANRIRGIPQDS